MIRVRIPSGAKIVSVMHVLTGSGLQDASVMWVRTESGLRRIFTVSGSMTATASPASVTGFAALAGSATITTNSTTVTPSGGSAPYTYAWAKNSGTGGTWSIASATSDTTKFTCSGVAGDTDYTAIFRCTITDATGGTATVDVQADVSNLGSLYS